MDPREEMFFFEGSGGRRLLGFLHPALGPVSGSAGAAGTVGLVYCHPFAEEKNQSHVVAVRAARRLAASGTAVLRFDFSGCGDSEGDLGDASADDWLEEIGRAADELKRRTGVARVGFWGLRAGANLAALHAASRPDAAFAMLWQPVPDLKTFATQFLRQKLATGLAAGGSGGSVKELVARLEAGQVVEVMGYPIKRKLYESLASKAAGPARTAYPFPVGVFAFGRDEAPPEFLQRMAQGIAAAGKGGPGPADMVHVKEDPFWDRYWRWDAPETAESAARWIGAVA